MCLNDTNTEEKIWRINRIEKIIEDNEKGLAVNREKFKSFSSDVVADRKNIPDDFIQCHL
jgi:hypothetical protein